MKDPSNTLDTNLIAPCLRDVSDPSIGVVSRLVVDTKKTNMDTARCKHWNLKFGIDGRSTPWLGAYCRHQVHIRLNGTFGLPGETLHTPYNCLLFWFILGTTEGMLDLCLCSVFWDWYLDYNVGSKQLIREISNHRDIDGNSGREGVGEENYSAIK
jgi:hypothetical protein